MAAPGTFFFPNSRLLPTVSQMPTAILDKGSLVITLPRPRMFADYNIPWKSGFSGHADGKKKDHVVQIPGSLHLQEKIKVCQLVRKQHPKTPASKRAACVDRLPNTRRKKYGTTQRITTGAILRIVITVRSVPRYMRKNTKIYLKNTRRRSWKSMKERLSKNISRKRVVH